MPTDDELYDRALAVVYETRQASSSFIQRRLRVGYNRAARLVEQMEQDGVVGPANGAKPREILPQKKGPRARGAQGQLIRCGIMLRQDQWRWLTEVAVDYAETRANGDPDASMVVRALIDEHRRVRVLINKYRRKQGSQKKRRKR